MLLKAACSCIPSSPSITRKGRGSRLRPGTDRVRSALIRGVRSNSEKSNAKFCPFVNRNSQNAMLPYERAQNRIFYRMHERLLKMRYVPSPPFTVMPQSSTLNACWNRASTKRKAPGNAGGILCGIMLTSRLARSTGASKPPELPPV